ETNNFNTNSIEESEEIRTKNELNKFKSSLEEESKTESKGETITNIDEFSKKINQLIIPHNNNAHVKREKQFRKYEKIYKIYSKIFNIIKNLQRMSRVNNKHSCYINDNSINF